jgi:hypothetical protein
MHDPYEALRDALGDRYALEREIGRGGMATVYLATDRKHSRPVAIKVLRAELAATIGPDRFLREIEIAAHLNHPHILPLHDSGSADDWLYYVMPFVEGETLKELLDREQWLPIEQALRIARGAADALAYAHDHGVIHRDVKPANILLSGDHAVLADFGIARALEAAGGDTLTITGLVVGSPHYMSPEQASASVELDGRSDIYSLACVLYEMLAGRPPFMAPTNKAVIVRHLTEEPPSLRTLRPAVSPAVEDLVFGCLAKKPADRLAGASEFARRLEELGSRLLVPSEAGRGHRGLRASVPFWKRWRWRTAAGILASLITALALWLVPAEAPTTNASTLRLFVAPFAGPDVEERGDGTDPAPSAIQQSFAAYLGWVTDLTIISRTPSDSLAASRPRTLPEVLKEAGEAGAHYLVTGELIPFTRGTQLAVSLYDVTGRNIARAVGGGAQGMTPDVAAERLALDLVTALAGEGVDLGPAARLVGGTESPLAIRYVLEGQRRIFEGDVDGSVMAFQRALETDSLFADAYFWLSTAEIWGPRWDYEAALGIIEAGLTRRSTMTGPRARLLEAQRHYVLQDAEPAIDAFQGIVINNPEMMEAWFGLGESLYHFAGFAGHRRIEAQAPFERVLATDSAFSLVLGHLAELTLWAGVAEPARLFTRRASTNETQELVYEAAYTLAFGSRKARDDVLASLSEADYGTLANLVMTLAHTEDLLPLADSVAGLFLVPDRTKAEIVRGAGYRIVLRAGMDSTEGLAEWISILEKQDFDKWLVATHLAGHETLGKAEPMLAWARNLFDAGRLPDFTLPINDVHRQAFRALVHEALMESDSAEAFEMLDRVESAAAAAVRTDPLPDALSATLQARLALLASDTTAVLRWLERAVARTAEPYMANSPLATMAPERFALAVLYLAVGDDRLADRWLESFRQTSAVGDVLYWTRAEETRQQSSADSRASR